MGLRDLVESVRERGLTLAINVPAGDDLVSEVRTVLADRNVQVVRANGARTPGTETPSVYSATATLLDGDRALLQLDAEDLRGIVDDGSASETVASFFEHLDERTFTSRDHAEMLEATREIEDRAWRVGTGTLLASFQRFSKFDPQQSVYDRLAETDLTVHVYGEPDADLPEGGYELHPSIDPDVRKVWAVVFDGGDEPDQATALVAEELSPGTFDGFWTYDGSLVEQSEQALRETDQLVN